MNGPSNCLTSLSRDNGTIFLLAPLIPITPTKDHMSDERKKIMGLFHSLCQQPEVVFPKPRQKLIAPKEHGVYIIRDDQGVIVHVGRTLRASLGLHQRLGNHLNSNSSFTREYLDRDGSKLRGIFTFQCLDVKNPRERALFESLAIGLLCPAHIGTGAGKK